MTGVSLDVDVERLRRYTFVGSGGLTLYEPGLGALELFLSARLFLYLQVYFHRTVRAIDLDLLLTSDHEWCTYRELDGIAIHQLITGSDGDDAVTTARFVWTGHEVLEDQAAQ